MEEIKEFPLVSIFAVCHKHDNYVIETLDSIRNQTYSNVELIIINNVKDECEGIINNWINQHKVSCVFIQNEHPKTVAQNCNLALSHCKGKYFEGVSCDDILLPQKIEKQVTVFLSNPSKLACVYSNVSAINESSQIIKNTNYFRWCKYKYGFDVMPRNDLSRYLGWGVIIPAVSALLNTEYVKHIGGYDESYLWEDWQMWVKLASNGFNFDYVNEILIYKRQLANSVSHTKYNDETQLQIVKMFADILVSNLSIFSLDYRTYKRFTLKFYKIYNLDKKLWSHFRKIFKNQEKKFFYFMIFKFDYFLIKLRLYNNVKKYESYLSKVIVKAKTLL